MDFHAFEAASVLDQEVHYFLAVEKKGEPRKWAERIAFKLVIYRLLRDRYPFGTIKIEEGVPPQLHITVTPTRGCLEVKIEGPSRTRTYLTTGKEKFPDEYPELRRNPSSLIASFKSWRMERRGGSWELRPSDIAGYLAWPRNHKEELRNLELLQLILMEAVPQIFERFEGDTLKIGRETPEIMAASSEAGVNLDAILGEGEYLKVFRDTLGYTRVIQEGPGYKPLTLWKSPRLL